MTDDLIKRLDHSRVVLKSGEFDGADLMKAWCAMMDAKGRIEAQAAEIAVIKRHIPMKYLQRHDAPDATGPTAALNLNAAMKDYAEDRWKLIDRLSEVNREIARLREALGYIAHAGDLSASEYGCANCNDLSDTARRALEAKP